MTARFARVVALTEGQSCEKRDDCRHLTGGDFFIFTFFLLAVLLFPWNWVHAKHQRSVPLSIYNQAGIEERSFAVPLKNDTGGVTVALQDVTDDGQPEIIIGNGYGNEPRVRYFGMEGKELSSFPVYDKSVGVGITVAACDVDGDGKTEVLVGKQSGGDPEVRIYTKEGQPFAYGSFMAYDAGFLGGVFVACGDINGDGINEVVTAPGPSGGPHIRVWQLQQQPGIATEGVFKEDSARVAGHLVAMPKTPNVAKIAFRNPERPDDLSVRHWGLAPGTVAMAAEEGPPTWALTKEYFDGDQTDTRGRVVMVVPGSGADHVVTEPILGQRAYDRIEYSAYDDLNGDGAIERVTVAGNYIEADPNRAKEVVVDLSEQRLYVYEYGLLKRSFFVSTGLAAYPTPTGSFKLEKVPSVLYSRYYGPDDPNNYDYGWVPNNLRIKPQYFIHTAYWHNDFGHRRSHGCVNVEKSNNDWIYGWADAGTPLTIRE